MRRKQRLRDYDPAEISLVDRPANYKKFLIHKQAGESVAKSNMEAIKKLPKALLSAIDKCAAGDWVQKVAGDDEAEDRAPLSEGAQAALKAIGRIMAPYRDELKDAHMDAIQGAVGIGDSQVHPQATPEGMDDDDDAVDTEGDDAADNADDDADADSKDSDSTPAQSGDIVSQAMDTSAKLPDKAFSAAMQAAQKAFAAALKTSVNKSAEDQDEAPAPDADSAQDPEDKPMGQQDVTQDNDKDKDAVNKSAYNELRAQFDELSKSHKDLVEKSAARDVELAEQREQALARDYAERARAYASIGDVDKIGAILKSSHGNKEAQDNLEAILKSAVARERATKDFGGHLLGEIGSSQAATGDTNSPEAQMKSLVAQNIEKSAGSGKTKEQIFVDTVMGTAEGRAMFKRMTQEGV